MVDNASSGSVFIVKLFFNVVFAVLGLFALGVIIAVVDVFNVEDSIDFFLVGLVTFDLKEGCLDNNFVVEEIFGVFLEALPRLE